MEFLRRLFGLQPAGGSGSTKHPSSESGGIGILFDIDDLGGGFYRYEAFKVLFKSLDPQQLVGCTLLDGDTSETLAGRSRTYVVAFQEADASQTSYVREALASVDEKGLLAQGKRFLEDAAVRRHPLVVAGRIDGHGRLTVREGEGIGEGWVKGTKWTVVKE